MKNLPLFSTEYGVASLILREIPYRGEAYVRLQLAQEPEALVRECAAFCRAAGAEAVYAAGHPCLARWPLHTAILRMQRDKEGLPETEAALFPVQRETLEQWRDLYNLRMRRVPNAAWMDRAGAEAMLAQGDGYFVHRGETLLGIGRASGRDLAAMASCAPGGGRETLLALAHALCGPEIRLEVASANEKGVRLYESLGFLPVEEISRWYRIC